MHIRSPTDAVKHGIGYLSEDRKRYGLALGMDVESNIVLASFKEFLNAGLVNRTRTRTTSQHYVEALSIKTPSLQQQVRNLSGGNQQKVVIGKWLTADTNILIFDEPTRGIDVGAKSEIYRLLNDLAAQGKSIIMISSELPEILRMSHRIVVMCEGRITGELTAAEATQERIMTFATQRSGIVAEGGAGAARRHFSGNCTREAGITMAAIDRTVPKQRTDPLRTDAARKLLAFAGLLVLVIVFSILSPFFLTFDNIIGIMLATAVNGVLALGVTFVIITGGIDLSVGTVMTLTAVMTGVTITNGAFPSGWASGGYIDGRTGGHCQRHHFSR